LRLNQYSFENILAVGRPAAPLAAVKLSEKETQRKLVATTTWAQPPLEAAAQQSSKGDLSEAFL